MPAQFGTGEITNRLRRLLDLRGKFPMQIDETAVPVVMVGEANRAPYRISGRKAWGVRLASALAGNFSYVNLVNQSPFYHVLHRVTTRCVPTVGGATDMVLGITNLASAPASSLISLVSTEFQLSDPVAAITEGVALSTDVQLTATDFFAAPGARLRQLSAQGAAATVLSVVFEDCDLVIPPQGVVLVRSEQLDQQLIAAFEVYYFDDHPINRLT